MNHMPAMPPEDHQPYLGIPLAVLILAFCVLFQIPVYLAVSLFLGKNFSLIVSLLLGLVLPAAIIVSIISPTPRATLRLRGISLSSACAIIGASLCFALLASCSVELALRLGKLPPKILLLLEEEEMLFREILSFQGPRDLYTVALAVVIIAPLAEELLFRGLLQGSLERQWGNWTGLVISGVAFGALHGQLRSLPVGLLGILMGYAVMRTNSILAGMLAHAANNGLVMILSFLVGADALRLSHLVLCVALGGLGLVIFLWLFRVSTLHYVRIPRKTRHNAAGHHLPSSDLGDGPSWQVLAWEGQDEE